LGLQWSRDRARKEKTRRRRMKITRGSPRMASKESGGEDSIVCLLLE